LDPTLSGLKHLKLSSDVMIIFPSCRPARRRNCG
jgi:hypothetical protein